MNRLTILLVVVLTSLYCGACNYETVTKGKAAKVYRIYKNSYRAKTIIGKNELWGEFKLILNYRDEALGVSYRLDENGDTVGVLSSGSIQDYVINISQDSIQRLEKRLIEQYGVGNFSLKDTINRFHRIQRNLLIKMTNYYPDGRIAKMSDAYYKRRIPISTSDADFTSVYDLVHYVHNYYEYNDEGRIITNRIFDDVYPDYANEPSVYIRKIYKHQTAYENEKVLSISLFDLSAGENFFESSRYVLNYKNNLLMTVDGGEKSIVFKYKENTISETLIEDVRSFYEFDTNHNLVKISDDRGNFMKIDYEVGHGSLSQYVPILDKQLGIPYIK